MASISALSTPTARLWHTARRRLRRGAAWIGIGLAGTMLHSPALAQIGMARLQVGDMPENLVYPTADTAREVTLGPFVLTVAPDATPSSGPRRLVVLSHGTGGSALSDHEMAAALARAGFVVAQPQHPGDNFQDASKAGPEAWRTRPGDVTRVIDALAADPRWRTLLKLDRVGVHGMSAGGVTALSLAGAQWRLLDLVQHCLAQGETDAGFCYNGLATAEQQAPRRASYESARGVPAAFLPAEMTALRGGRTPGPAGDDVRPDPRIAAVTLAVPVAALFTTDSLKRIAIPVGVVSAGQDRMLLPAFHSARVLRDVPQAVLLTDLSGAGHMDLLSPWPAAIAQAEAGRHPRGSSPEPGFDPAQRAKAFAAVAEFHQRHLEF